MPGYLRTDSSSGFADKNFDAVNKLRVSQPKALIDTDFEYGMQISKWENIGLVNNRTFSFPSSNTIPNVSAIGIPQNSKTITVTTSSAHGLSVGAPINVQDTFLSIGNGNFTIDTVPTTTTFTYTARAINLSNQFVTNGIYDPNKTAIYLGTAYTDSEIGVGLTLEALSDYSFKAIRVTTTVPHGLSLGNEVAIVGTTATTNAPNGSFFVSRIINATQFVYFVTDAPTGTIVGTSAKLYIRPQAQFLHRPFDGGVLFSANAGSNNQQAVRQTRRYFRYQSGKGMQISSGTVLKPNLSVESLTANSNIITVQTKEQHNLQPGSTIKIFGANEPDYNGTYTIVEILGYNLFQVIAPAAPFEPKASGNYYVTIDTWYGCENKIGMFDSQNGVFFEFDGSQLYAVRRSSTYQISGKISVENGSNTITQTNAAFPTNFARQLDPGDFIVIRGQSYRVESIANNTTLTISPSYRGQDADYVLSSKTVDTKIPQSEWNLDTMDGNGPSGYDLDLTKMQMFYIDYSWYGAGFIRWGLRGVDGNITYVHKLSNNNENAEAYMRSGNIPARYESNTFPKVTKITSSIGVTDTVINVKSTENFPPGATPTNPNGVGTLLIRSGSVYEYVSYTGKTATSFTGVTRARSGTTVNVQIAAGSNLGTVTTTAGLQVGQRAIHPNFPENTYISQIDGNILKFNTAALIANPTGVMFSPMAASTAQAFSYSPNTPISVELAFPTFSASISHWGTSVIMDGGFDDDKSLIFTFGQTVATTIPKAVTTPVSTTATGTSGSKQIVVANATGIVTGMSVDGPGVQEGTVVSIRPNGTTINLSLPLIADKSATAVTFTGGNQKALFSIRVAPSVDNGISANFGQRELINRMQLTLKSVGVITSTADSNLLVTAILNGVPNSAIPWTNIIKNSTVLTNSSLSQIADYSGVNEDTIIFGGEITGGFYVQGTSSIDLNDVRELGNSVLGGGEAFANTNVYPDGPDVLSIVVTNLSDTDVEVLGRLSWAEAQA
jgi:hypothetical protein